jgi:hypothetical protein
MGRLLKLPVIILLLITMLMTVSCGSVSQHTTTITTDTTETVTTTTTVVQTSIVTVFTTPATATTTTKTSTTNTAISPLDFDPSYIIISPDTASITAGENQAYTAMAYDNEGNALDITMETSFSIDKDAGGRWAFNNYTSENTGTWKVTGLYNDPVDGYESWNDSVALVVTQ